MEVIGLISSPIRFHGPSKFLIRPVPQPILCAFPLLSRDNLHGFRKDKLHCKRIPAFIHFIWARKQATPCRPSPKLGVQSRFYHDFPYPGNGPPIPSRPSFSDSHLQIAAERMIGCNFFICGVSQIESVPSVVFFAEYRHIRPDGGTAVIHGIVFMYQCIDTA